MKITQAQGRACLRELERVASSRQGYIDSIREMDADNALGRLGWCERANEGCYFCEDWRGYLNAREVMTALAMCAAIAGVRP